MNIFGCLNNFVFVVLYFLLVLCFVCVYVLSVNVGEFLMFLLSRFKYNSYSVVLDVEGAFAFLWRNVFVFLFNVFVVLLLLYYIIVNGFLNIVFFFMFIGMLLNITAVFINAGCVVAKSSYDERNLFMW